MNIDGKCLNGKFYQINKITRDWHEVQLDVIQFEVHCEMFLNLAQRSTGLFTVLDDDRSACLRFQLDDDATKFKSQYYD